MKPPRMIPVARLGCIGRTLAILLLLAVTAVGALLFAAPAPVLAAGDTVALSLTNAANLKYGVAPNFTAVVTFETKPTTSHSWSVKVTIAGGESFSNTSQPAQSTDGMTLTFTGLKPANSVPAGAHTATAQFTNPETSATATSDPVSFTVNKATVALACTINMNGENVVGAGKSISIQMATDSGKGSLPAEWLSGTFTVKLDGPTHATYASLTASSNFVVTATAPAQKGIYTLTCVFNGSANYTSSTFTSSRPYTISSLHALGTVQLYSTPTTLTAGQKIDFYVVFQPASGLPTPTGQFTLSFGSHHTNAFTLGSSGTFLIYFGTISSLGGATDIQIFYMGDANYDQATLHFPLTNQPIPPGIDGEPGGDGSDAQATTTTTATTTETPGDEQATPTAADAAGALTAPPADSGSNLKLILILAAAIMLVLAALGGGVAVIIYRMRRAGDDEDEQSSNGYPAATYGTLGRIGAYNGNGADSVYEPYSQSGQYRNGGQAGQAGQYGRSGQYRQAGQYGQYGQTGQTARVRRPGQYGANEPSGLTGKHRQPGQYGQQGVSGQSSKHRQPGQYGQSGQYRQAGQNGQTGKYRQYRDRGASPDDDTYRSGRDNY